MQAIAAQEECIGILEKKGANIVGQDQDGVVIFPTHRLAEDARREGTAGGEKFSGCPLARSSATAARLSALIARNCCFQSLSRS